MQSQGLSPCSSTVLPICGIPACSGAAPRVGLSLRSVKHHMCINSCRPYICTCQDHIDRGTSVKHVQFSIYFSVERRICPESKAPKNHQASDCKTHCGATWVGTQGSALSQLLTSNRAACRAAPIRLAAMRTAGLPFHKTGLNIQLA